LSNKESRREKRQGKKLLEGFTRDITLGFNKDQLISEAMFLSSNLPKGQQKFWKDF
jgi:hypothetical protein